MSIDSTLAERGERYGDFSDHAAICQKIKLAFLYGPARWDRLSDVQKQALTVIADKIARILSGDPNYADNWHDIQGYAKLVEDRLPKPVVRAMEIEAPGLKPGDQALVYGSMNKAGGIDLSSVRIVPLDDEPVKHQWPELNPSINQVAAVKNCTTCRHNIVGPSACQHRHKCDATYDLWQPRVEG